MGRGSSLSPFLVSSTATNAGAAHGKSFCLSVPVPPPPVSPPPTAPTRDDRALPPPPPPGNEKGAEGAEPRVTTPPRGDSPAPTGHWVWRGGGGKRGGQPRPARSRPPPKSSPSTHVKSRTRVGRFGGRQKTGEWGERLKKKGEKLGENGAKTRRGTPPLHSPPPFHSPPLHRHPRTRGSQKHAWGCGRLPGEGMGRRETGGDRPKNEECDPPTPPKNSAPPH